MGRNPAQRGSPRGFPIWRAVFALSAAACVILVAASWAVAVMFGEGPDNTRAVGVAAVVAWGSSLIGIIPVAIFYERGLLAAVQGYFLGMGARVIICVGTTAVAVGVWRFPGGVWATTLLSMYLPLLFIEVAIIGHRVWGIGMPVRETVTIRPNDRENQGGGPTAEVLTPWA